MDLSTFDFRTGKMLMSKMNKSRQRVRYDSSNQVKVSRGGASATGEGAAGRGGRMALRWPLERGLSPPPSWPWWAWPQAAYGAQPATLLEYLVLSGRASPT